MLEIGCDDLGSNRIIGQASAQVEELEGQQPVFSDRELRCTNSRPPDLRGKAKVRLRFEQMKRGRRPDRP